MKIILALIPAFLFLKCPAQKENLLVKFCPLALADDVSFPTIQGGLEFKLKGRLTWYNEAGIKYRTSSMDNSDTSYLNSSGYKLKTEIRYYFQRRQRQTFNGFYFAVNAFLTHDSHNTEINYRNDSTLRRDAFGVKKNIFGINIPIGFQKTRRKIIFDLYCGPGIRFRSVTTINKEYNKSTDFIIHPIDLNIPAMRQDVDASEEGNSIVPNWTMGMRICFKL